VSVYSDSLSLTSLEGLNFDQTVNVLQKYSDQDNATVKVIHCTPLNYRVYVLFVII
jgi:hypothetical protein